MANADAASNANETTSRPMTNIPPETLDLRQSELRGHPIGAAQPIAVGPVVGEVIAVRDDEQLDRYLDLRGDPLRILPRDQAVLLAGDEEERAFDLLRRVLQREGARMRARFVHRAQVASHAEGFARELRQGVENRAPIVRTRETNARTNALLVGHAACAVIAAEADTPKADARCIEIAAAGDPIDDRCRRDFVVAANRKAVFGFALTRTVDQQRGHAAREERQLVGFELFLGGVEPGNHHDDRRARGGTRGPTQDPSEVIAFKGYLDAL